jgi:hypothetical protein
LEGGANRSGVSQQPGIGGAPARVGRIVRRNKRM